jgi:ABC-type transport system involved in cytochrome c biogenesis permease subunit
MNPSLVFVAVLAAAAGPQPRLTSVELAAVRMIAVQDGGRVKPLDTFAREIARRIGGARAFGAESIRGLDPAEWVLAMVADPERWRSEPMVRVTSAELRRATELPADRDRFTFAELAAHRPFTDLAASIQDRLRANPETRLQPVDQEVQNLYGALSIVAGIYSGEALRVVPRPDEPEAAWLTLDELGKATGDPARARDGVSALVSAYAAGDGAAVSASADELRATLGSLAPGIYPADADLAREVRYNVAKPFRSAWTLYLLGLVFLLSSLPLNVRRLAWAGFAMLAAGLFLHTWGLGLRVLISGRAPVTNMYESVVFVAWGAVALALAFEARHRVRFVAAAAAALAVGCLILADSVPILDSSIEPLVPVLRDNTWLTLHVLTITLGYAAFLLATGLAHLNLGVYFLAPARASLLKTLSHFLYRVLGVGTLLLAMGTLLGGVWASYSWGRFWGWDPKETWSLVALLGYVALLHGRFVAWVRDFGLAVGSIAGFLLVLMAWYGVNFILGTGLHSYGFGTGGYWYVVGFVLFEMLVVGVACARHPAAPRASAASTIAAAAAAR